MIGTTYHDQLDILFLTPDGYTWFQKLKQTLKKKQKNASFLAFTYLLSIW